MNLLCRSYNGSAKVVLLFYSSKLFVIFFKIYFKILITQIPTWISTTTLRTPFRERKDRTLFLYFKTFKEVFFEIVMRDSGNYANKHNPIYQRNPYILAFKRQVVPCPNKKLIVRLSFVGLQYINGK
jgi:hypothetical protein